MGQYYSLMCMLPPVPMVLGDRMQLGLGEIAGIIKRNIHQEHLELAFAHLHSIDVLNWEQLDQGRSLFIEGGLLTREEMESARDLPDFIRRFREEKERGIHRAYPYDRLWELYYSYAHDEAERFGCRFLIDYLNWEIELRSSLSAARVRETGGNVEDHAVLGAFRPRDNSNLINQFKARKNPLDAERFLDEERLRQIYLFEGSSGFSIDALLAYISRSAIYSRWEKINDEFNLENYLGMEVQCE